MAYLATNAVSFPNLFSIYTRDRISVYNNAGTAFFSTLKYLTGTSVSLHLKLLVQARPQLSTV